MLLRIPLPAIAAPVYATGIALGLALGLSGCGPSEPEGPIEVAVIGEPDNLRSDGLRLSPAAQALRAASSEGLVTLDRAGDVVPGLAERWIVTDDGLSYIFRLRERDWPDGEPISAGDVRRALSAIQRQLEGTTLGLDLAKISEVRAMTDRIIELRLASPMPEFLRLLAQPELGIRKDGEGAGPMVAEGGEEDTASLQLTVLPPEARGLPAPRRGGTQARSIALRAMPAAEAIAAFSRRELDLIVNGQLASFPQIELGPLSRGAVQLDPALGLMGLRVRRTQGVLADPALREALSMALDRAALIEPFGLGGWQPTSWIVPPALFAKAPLPADRWDNLSLEERRDLAAARFARWRAANGEDAITVRIEMPPGPGSDLMFQGIARAWAPLGVRAQKVAPGTGAELQWIDRLARYSSPRWFLNQFNCEVSRGPCSAEADDLVLTSIYMRDADEKEAALAQAHQLLVAAEVFIPVGAPVRWSLVRGAIDAYQPNPWGQHPLFPLADPTI